MKNLLGRSRERSFNEYSKYLETKGLNSEEVNAVKEFLNEFCKKTGYLWKPGFCRIVPDLLETAEKTLKNSIARKYFDTISVHRFTVDGHDAHFFLTLLSTDGKEFIIDPTGVPKEGKSWSRCFEFPNDIRPYFGLVDFSTSYHRIIYGNSS